MVKTTRTWKRTFQTAYAQGYWVKGFIGNRIRKRISRAVRARYRYRIPTGIKITNPNATAVSQVINAYNSPWGMQLFDVIPGRAA